MKKQVPMILTSVKLNVHGCWWRAQIPLSHLCCVKFSDRLIKYKEHGLFHQHLLICFLGMSWEKGIWDHIAWILNTIIYLDSILFCHDHFFKCCWFNTDTFKLLKVFPFPSDCRRHNNVDPSFKNVFIA